MTTQPQDPNLPDPNQDPDQVQDPNQPRPPKQHGCDDRALVGPAMNRDELRGQR